MGDLADSSLKFRLIELQEEWNSVACAAETEPVLTPALIDPMDKAASKELHGTRVGNLHAPGRRAELAGQEVRFIGYELKLIPALAAGNSEELTTNGVSCYRMARPGGLEPPTPGLEGRCSIRLSYGRMNPC